MAESDSGMQDASSPTPTATTTAAIAFTPAKHISELNETDLLISTLLSSAATATGILSNSRQCTELSSSSSSSAAAAVAGGPLSLADAQAQLTQSIDTFFSSLNTIEVRLRRNIYALEEAGLVEPGDEKDARKGRMLVGAGGGGPGAGAAVAATAAAAAAAAAAGADAAGGVLDSSWLNARADNGVMAGVKRQLVAEVKAFLGDEWKEGERN